MSIEREDMISPDLQMIAITDYCKRHGYTIVQEVQDLDLSGRFWRPRRIEEVVAMIEQGEADVVVVWRWSRMTRNRLDWAIAVDRLERVGGRLESATEGFDVTTAVGRFARGMLAEFAAFESDRIGDIWREVRERRVRLGLPAVGSLQFGYRKVDGQYLPDRRTGPILVELYRRYDEGASYVQLGAWLKSRRVQSANPQMGWKRAHRYHWHGQCVAEIMDRGFAAGLIKYKGDTFRGAHQPLITEQQWLAYQQRRGVRAIVKHHMISKPLTNEIVYCRCGRRMNILEETDRLYRRYVCLSRHGRHSRNHTMQERRLHSLLYRWLVRLAMDPIEASRAQRGALRFATENAVEARRLARSLHTADSDAQADLVDALATAQRRSALIDPRFIAHSLVEDWDSLDNEYKRTQLERLLTRIDVQTGYEKAKLTIATIWGDTETITAGDRQTPPCNAVMRTDHWLGAADAARYAAVSVETVRDWRRGGLLPNSMQLGNHFLYAQSDLDRVAHARANGYIRKGGKARLRAQIQSATAAESAAHDEATGT